MTRTASMMLAIRKKNAIFLCNDIFSTSFIYVNLFTYFTGRTLSFLLIARLGKVDIGTRLFKRELMN